MDSKLLKAIQSRPTLTIIPGQTEDSKVEFDNLPKIKKFREDVKVPETFDGRVVWKGLLTPPKNQGSCGSCWAFASTSTLSDRFNIQSVGQMNIDLSPTKLILCEFGGKEWDLVSQNPELNLELDTKLTSQAINTLGCKGNTLLSAWRYLYIFGTPTEDCLPYNKKPDQDFQLNFFNDYKDSFNLPSCTLISGPLRDMCSNIKIDKGLDDEYGDPSRHYKCIHIYSIAGTPEDDGSEYLIRLNIYQWGPVSTGMVVYPDFYTFDPKKEIYEWDGKGNPIGGHAIEIVGWGEDNGKKYWIVKNSWGPEWGLEGYFYMVRGNNNCKIEQNIITGVPDYFYPLDNYFSEDPDKDILQWVERKDKDIISRRNILETEFSTLGGGIDPETGYSRRVLINKPWISIRSPINIDDLPNWPDFISGRDASFENRQKFKSIDNEKININFYFAFFLIILLIILIIIYMFKFKDKSIIN